MPYKLAKKGDKFCVVKESDGSVEKCHASRDDAVKHLKALYVNAADASIASLDEDAEVVVEETTGPEVIAQNVTASLDTDTSTNSVVAHAEPLAPPPDFFTDPQLPSLQRYVTITDDGRFYTHLAAHGECHVGYGDMCVSPPQESDYSHFAVGTVIAADGNSIPTGVIALKGGHADIGLDAASARAHYDDPTSAVADVVVGTDEFGIWISGALRPGVTEDQIRMLRASGVSGDWRLIDGELRLVGICSVNVPGFPKLSIAASAEGLTALVAAGGPPEPHPDLCTCHDSTQDILDELDQLHRLVADAGLEEVALSKLAERIPPDDAELDGLYSRVT